MQEDNGQETSKEDAAGPKIEADSTTPIREPEKQDKVSVWELEVLTFYLRALLQPASTQDRGFLEDRRRQRPSSPPRDRRLASRLGPRDLRDSGRRFRSRLVIDKVQCGFFNWASPEFAKCWPCISLDADLNT